MEIINEIREIVEKSDKEFLENNFGMRIHPECIHFYEFHYDYDGMGYAYYPLADDSDDHEKVSIDGIYSELHIPRTGPVTHVRYMSTDKERFSIIKEEFPCADADIHEHVYFGNQDNLVMETKCDGFEYEEKDGEGGRYLEYYFTYDLQTLPLSNDKLEEKLVEYEELVFFLEKSSAVKSAVEN